MRGVPRRDGDEDGGDNEGCGESYGREETSDEYTMED